MLQSTPKIRAAVLLGFPALASELGVDSLEELDAAGIAPAELHDPDHKISIIAVGRLLENVALKSAVSDVGLRLSQSIDFQRFGLIGFLVQDKATVGEAFEAIRRHSRFHNEALSLWLEPMGSQIAIRLDFVGKSSEPLRQLTEMVAGVIFHNFRALAGAQCQALRVSFRHGTTDDGSRHRAIFGCPVHFGGDFDAVIVEQADLARPNQLLNAGGRDRLAQLRAAGLMPQSNDIVDVVQRLICGLLPTGECGVDHVAACLNMSSRTLHRKLAVHDETFSDLLNSVRRDFALRHLVASGRQLTAIADLLGFKSLSDFSNWFRRQFGMSPTQWTRQGGG